MIKIRKIDKMKTLKEKVDYNRKRSSSDQFAAGYIIGVTMYNDYPKLDDKGKAETRNMIGDYNKIANGKDRNSTAIKLSKGIMCGIRDSANERKRRK